MSCLAARPSCGPPACCAAMNAASPRTDLITEPTHLAQLATVRSEREYQQSKRSGFSNEQRACCLLQAHNCLFLFTCLELKSFSCGRQACNTGLAVCRHCRLASSPPLPPPPQHHHTLTTVSRILSAISSAAGAPPDSLPTPAPGMHGREGGRE